MDGALPATKNVTYSVVVKKCIISALKHDLPTVVRDHFFTCQNLCLSSHDVLLCASYFTSHT